MGGKSINKQSDYGIPLSRNVPNFELREQTVEKCHGILVLTGVDDESALRVDSNLHGHRDFSQRDKFYSCEHVAKNVLEAVTHILKEENV